MTDTNVLFAAQQALITEGTARIAAEEQFTTLRAQLRASEEEGERLRMERDSLREGEKR